jgi:aryl-alcohol dehydrogenase-like predicted oxidoreductase
MRGGRRPPAVPSWLAWRSATASFSGSTRTGRSSPRRTTVDARARRFHSRLLSAMPERAVNPAEIPLLWLLGDPAISVTICGATDPSQVRGIAKVARRQPLSHDERVLVERIAEECFAPDRVGTAGT